MYHNILPNPILFATPTHRAPMQHPQNTYLCQLPSNLGEGGRELLPQNGEPGVDPCVDGDGVLQGVPLLHGLFEVWGWV